MDERTPRFREGRSFDCAKLGRLVNGELSSILADAGTQEESWRQISAAKEGSEPAHGTRCADSPLARAAAKPPSLRSTLATLKRLAITATSQL